MFQENVREGFEVFIHDGDKAIGAVRKFSPHGRRELVIYVENAGDFVVPLECGQGRPCPQGDLEREKLGAAVWRGDRPCPRR